MTASEAILAAAAAVIVFWLVGAYNRLVRLRTALVGRFANVDVQLKQRHALLQAQHTLLSAALASAGPRLEALRAACFQADAAREKARVRPGTASAIASLRAAEDILADARGRLPQPASAGQAAVSAAAGQAEGLDMQSRLLDSDSALGFARREFNESVAEYNEAVRQFPTLLAARLFGFRSVSAF